MPRTFFAICRVDDKNLIRRIPIRAAVQTDLEDMFDQQEQAFLKGRDDEVDFDGRWIPDSNQLLVIEDDALAVPFAQTLQYGAAAYDHLDVSNYARAGIKGIFSPS